MVDDLTEELRAATRAIVESNDKKKLIVAGPGAGKTFTFRSLLSRTASAADVPVVITFINNLKDDLERELGAIAKVYTFHGFCRSLLHAHPSYRQGLTESFDYFPPLPQLVKRDWEMSRGTPAPHFVAAMRDLQIGEGTEFYARQAVYYDAVSFDDSVFRVHSHLSKRPEEIPSHPLILVDEYQDFNRLEADLISLLSTAAPIVIAGDDDQALYSALRGASPEYIRALHQSAEFHVFSLPFSMRCTEAVVNAVHDVIGQAEALKLLQGRIPKEYRYFPPKKASDSQRYPTIFSVRTTVQSKRNNYFGRYIEQEIRKIPADEIQESRAEHFPTVLVIGPTQYLRQIQAHLSGQGFPCELSQTERVDLNRVEGLRRIQQNPAKNLGWRIVIEADRPLFSEQVIGRAVADRKPLVELIPDDYRARINAEIDALPDEEDSNDASVEEVPQDELVPTIRFTTFEGAKGLSAQHVFIVGLHAGDLPRSAANITDMEVCKFLVALTRTRKQCHLLHTSRWGSTTKSASPFISWVATQSVVVSKNYWSS